ncbi:MAG: hypothetical protein WC503_03245 [Candidatus Shapirobacteria bacterium]
MKNKLKKATTIVELTLYMGLLSIFLLILFDLFSQIISTQTRSVAVSLVQTNGNFLLSKLTHDINQANAITIPASIGSSAVSMTLTIGTTNASYTVSNGRLTITDSSGTFNLSDVDTTVSNFVVTRLGNSGGKAGLKIIFTLTSNVVDNSNLKTKTYQTFVSLR